MRINVGAVMLSAPPEGTPGACPCVDCGLVTGNFCDGGPSVGYDKCFAANRVPQDYKETGGYGMQRTPLCAYCETYRGYCRFCRGVQGCTPKTTRHHWSGVPQRKAREFDEEQARLAVLREFEARASAAVDKLRQKWSSPEN